MELMGRVVPPMQCSHTRGNKTEAQSTHGSRSTHPWAHGTCPTPAREVFELAASPAVSLKGSPERDSLPGSFGSVDALIPPRGVALSQRG